MYQKPITCFFRRVTPTQVGPRPSTNSKTKSPAEVGSSSTDDDLVRLPSRKRARVLDSFSDEETSQSSQTSGSVPLTRSEEIDEIGSLESQGEISSESSVVSGQRGHVRDTAKREHREVLRPGILKRLQQQYDSDGKSSLHSELSKQEPPLQMEIPMESTNGKASSSSSSSVESEGIHSASSGEPSGATEVSKEVSNGKAVSEESEVMHSASSDITVGPSTSKSVKTTDITNKETNFNPALPKFCPVTDAFWPRAIHTPYLALAKTLDCVERESSRLKIIDTLANYYRAIFVLNPDDALPSLYLCLNRLGPAFEGLELGIADTTLMKAIADSTGRTLAQVKADLSVHGDLGIVAEISRRRQHTMFKAASLTVQKVFTKFREIAAVSGSDSVKTKVSKVMTLLASCQNVEARFIIRSLSGKLRIGLAEQSVLQALAVAYTKTPPQPFPPSIKDYSSHAPEDYKKRLERNALLIKTAFCECPDYGKIVPVLLDDGTEALPEKCHITAGIPVKPMLAHPTKGIQEIFQRFEGSSFTCEWKYDGERAQIHMTESGQFSVFSRNQENNTLKYPDIGEIMKKAASKDAKSYILDCEAVAWDPEAKQILPFQILSTRKRKIANASEIKVQVCVYAFDLLLLNGDSLIQKPLCERRSLLKNFFLPFEGEFQFAQSMDTSVMEEVQVFLDDAIQGKCEGLMVKTLEQDATYEIAKRSHKWLKLKKDYLDGVGDTIDVVVLGGYKGQGKRAGVYGGFLLACYDPNGEEFQTLCKIGTGFSDDDLMKHSTFFKEHIIPEPKSYYHYDKSHAPDDWFDAVQVWEIKGADLTFSPTHWAAKGLAGDPRGISLRFPRFLRIRDDKAVTDATSSEQIAEMYLNQKQIMGNVKSNVEDDFY